jgi:hypothetical protein
MKASSSTLTTSSRRRLLITFAVILVVVVALASVFRFGAMPNAQATMIQHTFGDDISISISGFGNLSDASLIVYILSGTSSLRVPIINLRIEAMGYEQSLPYSASATLPTLGLPQTVEIQTFFDDGNFDFLRTHQNVSVRVVVVGTWNLASTNLGSIQFSTDTCCVQP